MQNKNISRYAVLTGLVIIAAITRIISHNMHFIPNVSPIMAVAIFGGAYFADKRIAFLIPLISMLISDLFIGFHNDIAAVYFSFALGVFLGYYIRKRIKPSSVIISSLTGSLIFFLITNFSVWLVDGWYPLNFAGLTDCFIKAVPFFRTALIGDIIYCCSLFGFFALAEKRIPSLAKVKN